MFEPLHKVKCPCGKCQQFTIDPVQCSVGFKEPYASLLAAAPDLYTALVDAIAMLEHYTSGRPDNWDGSTRRQARSVIKHAMHTLAAARGEENA